MDNQEVIKLLKELVSEDLLNIQTKYIKRYEQALQYAISALEKQKETFICGITKDKCCYCQPCCGSRKREIVNG